MIIIYLTKLTKLLYLDYLHNSYKKLFCKEIPHSKIVYDFFEKEFSELYEIKSGYIFEINPMLSKNKAQKVNDLSQW